MINFFHRRWNELDLSVARFYKWLNEQVMFCGYIGACGCIVGQLMFNYVLLKM